MTLQNEIAIMENYYVIGRGNEVAGLYHGPIYFEVEFIHNE